MCGFSGFLGGRVSHSSGEAQRLLRAMARTIHHRGPDSSDVWHDGETGIAFSHNRLAIVELSPAGAQPMHSASGRFVLIYNGEIYNHMDIRAELESAGVAPVWRGHSDTETLLVAFESFGVEETLKRAIGMFAFALWDRSERVLVLGRDRLGEKPLYYGWQGSGTDRTFLFASELKPMLCHPAFAGEIDRQALTSFMRFGYVPAPGSIYRDIHKLAPGSFAVVPAEGDDLREVPYWSAPDEVSNGTAASFAGSETEAVDQLEHLLLDAVGKQMMSDVPLGAFLSGGVDSSTIVALMQAQSARPVKTFSIGFSEEGYDEAQYAKAVAQHVQTDHTELYVSADEAMEVIPELPTIYDEPFADSSQIPTYLVSRLAREHVTVSLSGDAGDELFGGYNRYGLTNRLWSRLSSVPHGLRGAAAKVFTGISPASWDRFAKTGAAVVPALGRLPNPGQKIHKGAAVLASGSAAELYRGMVSHWRDPAEIVIGGSESGNWAWNLPGWPGRLTDVERMMATDLVTYLPDDILVKVDRAAMAVSLESRVPLLDHRVVELAWSMPLSMKIRNGTTKWALREVLYRYVPRALIERPKMGFGLPIDSWLRGPMKAWAEELLDERRLRKEGFFDPAPIRSMWELHQSGKADVQYLLWDALMFQAWLESIAGGQKMSEVRSVAAARG
jgi:asparagine synthase (glutamine-hydrolysing)